MAKPTVSGDEVKVGDTLYMTTIGQYVRVIDVAHNSFYIDHPVSKGRYKCASEARASRGSKAPMFAWDAICEIPTRKGMDTAGLFGEFLEFVGRIRERIVDDE